MTEYANEKEKNDSIPQRALWRAVIYQAMIDIRGPIRGRVGSNHKLHQWAALNWLDSRDFIEICHLADIDADYARRRLKSFLD
jgi:hypothetical protein